MMNNVIPTKTARENTSPGLNIRTTEGIFTSVSQ